MGRHGKKPVVPALWRARIYIACVVFGAANVAVWALLGLFGAVSPEKATQGAGIVTTMILSVSSGLAVGYRPGAPPATPLPGESEVIPAPPEPVQEPAIVIPAGDSKADAAYHDGTTS